MIQSTFSSLCGFSFGVRDQMCMDINVCVCMLLRGGNIFQMTRGSFKFKYVICAPFKVICGRQQEQRGEPTYTKPVHIH